MCGISCPVEMSKFSRIQEIKATTTAAIQVTALESESISILLEKYNFPVLCCEILISGMFCNVGWPAGWFMLDRMGDFVVMAP